MNVFTSIHLSSPSPSLLLTRLYRLAYSYLLEIMYLGEDRIMEFKLIAGFLNYKVRELTILASFPGRHSVPFHSLGPRLQLAHHSYLSD